MREGTILAGQDLQDIQTSECRDVSNTCEILCTHHCKCQGNLYNTCIKYFWGKDLDYPKQRSKRQIVFYREVKTIILDTCYYPCHFGSLYTGYHDFLCSDVQRRKGKEPRRKGRAETSLGGTFLCTESSLYHGYPTALCVKGPQKYLWTSNRLPINQSQPASKEVSACIKDSHTLLLEKSNSKDYALCES